MEESVNSLNLLPRVKPYVDNFVAGIRQDGIEHLFKLHTPSIGDKNGMNNKAFNLSMYDFRGNEMELYFKFFEIDKRLYVGKMLLIYLDNNLHARLQIS